MPAYEFQDETGGVEVVLFRTIECRDEPEEHVLPSGRRVRLHRRPVPSGVGIAGCARQPTMGDGVLDTYRRLEARDGSGMGRGGFTPEQIKRAWSAPDND